MIRPTPHPQWVGDFLEVIRPYEDKVINCRIFRDINYGTLSIKQFQGALVNFYPLIESFPQYMALNLAKVPPGDFKWNRKTRDWLISNISQERLHTCWWKQFAAGFGVPVEALIEPVFPPPEIDALNNYLWRICTHGSLAEGVAAANYAIEGPTGRWTKSVARALEKYAGVDGVILNDKTMEWVVAHANYDDLHPEEALEIVKAHATTRDEQERVTRAAVRALEYYALALETCYDAFR